MIVTKELVCAKKLMTVNVYMADGLYAEWLFRNHRDKIVFDTRFACYYNVLKPK